MSDINFICFALTGSDEMNEKEIKNLQSMLGKRYEVNFKISGEYETRLLTIKKKAQRK
jgi:hypothetical protein